MPGDDALGQIARNVGNLERRVHMLESITRPQARARIASIFKRDLSVAVGLGSEGGHATAPGDDCV